MTLRGFEGSSHPENSLPFQTFKEVFDSAASNESTFLRFYRQGKLSNELSFARYVSCCRRLFSFLCENYFVESEFLAPVIVAMPNSDALLVVFGALLDRGLPFIPVNPKESDEYLRKIALHSGAKLIISDRERCLDKDVLVLRNWRDLDCCLQLGTAAENQVFPASSRLSALFYTSGTTGRSKGVCLSQTNLLANAEALVRTHKLEPGHRHMCVLPLIHVNAFGFSFLSTLVSKGVLILNDRFDGEHFWQVLEAEQVGIVSIVPEVAKRLLQGGRESFSNLSSSFRYAVSAASALQRQVGRRFYEDFGVKVLQGYGLSEAVNFSLMTPSDVSLKDCDDPSRLSAGIPIWGNDVGVMAEDGSLLEEGQVGEVVIRGWNVMQGYFNNDEATNEAFRYGWLHTGDLGYFRYDHQGRRFFFLCGRLKEVIKRNSETLYPQDIDELVQQIRGCQDSAVFGYDNEDTGEDVGLAIVANEDTPCEENILLELKERIPNFKRPKKVFFVDSIPRTVSMKVQRSLLSSQFESSGL